MLFIPKPSQQLVIEDQIYQVDGHPAIPGIAYGQEGKQAIVYKTTSSARDYAIKVFKPRFRNPGMVSLSSRLVDFAHLPGMSVCQRTVLRPQKHAALLQQYPDLTYAVVMPWISGPTWSEVVSGQCLLTHSQSLTLAQRLAGVLCELEQQGLAHCDLSDANLILPILDCGEEVELVDIEDLYSAGFNRPQHVPAGTPGYAHRTAADGLWCPEADRFAGAVLLAEMLGWCEPRVRDARCANSYFGPKEMQTECARYRLLVNVLNEIWGSSVDGIFASAWHSETLADCPNFGEWVVTLASCVVPAPASSTSTQLSSTSTTPDAVTALISLADMLEAQDNLNGARTTLCQALAIASGETPMRVELERRLARLDAPAKVGERLVEIAHPPMSLEERDQPQKPLIQFGAVSEDLEVTEGADELEKPVVFYSGLPETPSRDAVIRQRSQRIAVLAGLAALLVFIFWQPLYAFSINLPAMMGMILTDAIIAAVAGATQLVLLREQIWSCWLWVLAFAAGGAILGALTFSYMGIDVVETMQAAGVNAALIGAGVGLAQVGLLRQKKSNTWWIWMLVNALAWGLGWLAAHGVSWEINSALNKAIAVLAICLATGIGVSPLVRWSSEIEI